MGTLAGYYSSDAVVVETTKYENGSFDAVCMLLILAITLP